MPRVETQPKEVVDRHKNKLMQALANIPQPLQQKFGNLLTGAALNFLSDAEFDECMNAARVTIAADGADNVVTMPKPGLAN